MAYSSGRVQIISKLEMESKFADAEELLRTCKRILIKSSPTRIVVHKRERAYRLEGNDGETVAIIYFYSGPDESERQSIRLLVVDGITYTLEAKPLPTE
jgi:hypothetical protein